MLKLDKYLEKQMNAFHGGYMDFIYKVNQVLEHNNIKTSYYEDAVTVFKNGGGFKTLNGGNGLKKQFELNNELFWITSDLLTEIDGLDKHLHLHLQTVLKRIYQKLSDRLIYPVFTPPNFSTSIKSKSDES
tara:strand:+ start:400 stop:792 length:393 start_codon:yes stop_codon:yes gene_type:complete